MRTTLVHALPNVIYHKILMSFV